MLTALSPALSSSSSSSLSCSSTTWAASDTGRGAPRQFGFGLARAADNRQCGIVIRDRPLILSELFPGVAALAQRLCVLGVSAQVRAAAWNHQVRVLLAAGLERLEQG